MTALPLTGSTNGRCPKCGDDLETGFGLAGGGYGVYEFCDQCGDIITKDQEHTEKEPSDD